MATPLKDRFDKEVVEILADRFSVAVGGFDRETFVADLLSRFPSLELKERVNLVADRLATDLPADYPTALSVVLQVAPSGIGEWAAWPLCSFVERHGVGFPVESLDAMSTLTQHWSCEFAVRPYLEDHLELTRQYLGRWVNDPHEAVRRLASEGTRPLLPWGPRVKALTDDPGIGIEVLVALRHDPSENVRRSVANHLNDLARSHPDLVVDLLAEWSAGDPPPNSLMIRHALRTLVKQGHPGALELLGFTVDPEVSATRFSCDPDVVSLGAIIEMTAELTSTSTVEQMLVIDFIIHHVSGSGGTSPKVFKWTTQSLAPGETVTLTKRRRIITASTRRFQAGFHRIELQISGKVLADTGFHLREGSPSAT
ncbi:MAG: DNA alkylation repair protein [Acidimicrobiia bacterium]|nr:DNA alkylation repair protein [Acidimicrobiia bacterium]